MKAATVLLAMFGLVAAQKMSDAVPECAVPCLERGISSATDCSVDDSDCLCEVQNYRDIYDAAQACVLQSCGAGKSIEEVLPAAAAFCSDVTGGATAPPVDESPSATDAAGSSGAVTSAPAGETTAASSGTAASAASDATASGATVAETTTQPGAAAAGSIGGLGMLALGVLAAF